MQYYEAHNGPISALQFDRDGAHLISGSADNLLKVYDLLEGRVLYTIRAHQAPVKTVRFTRDGRFFATAGADKVIYLWQSNFDRDNNGKDIDIDINSSAAGDILQQQRRSMTQSMASRIDEHDRHGVTSSPSAAAAGAGSASASRTSLNTVSSDNRHDGSSADGGAGGRRSRSRSCIDLQRDASASAHGNFRFANYDNCNNRAVDGAAAVVGAVAPGGTMMSMSMSHSPEHNLLQGIVSQISTLTDAITLIERRLAVIENVVSGGAMAPISGHKQ